ncbi:MAG TPA: hypothetical protein PLP20_02640 [Oscillospiraceae bacterium]|nr:hypothetical protein [Oscillospiraceae bacterium]HNW04265.1 hypothetical protein [Oscillospiraceae bacterium]HPV99933.1 hypothetical protein [Oscillospiraceae bacterium]
MAMNRNMAAIFSGVAAATAIGTAIYAMSGNSRNVRKLRRSARRTMSAVGSIVDGVSAIMH